jgi:ribosomal protein S17E
VVLTTLSSGFIAALWLQAMALLLHLQNRQRQRQRQRQQQFTRRLFRDRKYPLDFLSDQQIIRNYHLDTKGIYTLCDELQEDLEESTKRSRSLPVSLQIMRALRYYASGSYMNVIGDVYGVSKMSVSRCINIVSKCIANNIKNYIKLHMSVGERQVIYDFYDTKEFPLVLGAVDGTLIPIKAPSVDEHLYVCRKGYLL